MKKERSIKTFSVLFTCLLFLIMGSLIVYGDLIYIPDNDFSAIHECKNMNRTFIANGADGNISIWEDPESDNEVGSYSNGTEFFVYQTYTDENGDVWGLICQKYDSITYWIRMNDVILKYDSTAFIEEHRSELQNYNSDYTVNSDTVLIWTYPNSGDYETLNDNNLLNKIFSISYTYTDTNGNTWGYISYHYGMKDKWIQMDKQEDHTVSSGTDIITPVESTESSGISVTSESSGAYQSTEPAETDYTGLSSEPAETYISDESVEAANIAALSALSESNQSAEQAEAAYAAVSSITSESYKSINSDQFTYTAAVLETSDSSPLRNTTKLIVLMSLIAFALAATAIMIHIFWKKNKSNN